MVAPTRSPRVGGGCSSCACWFAHRLSDRRGAVVADRADWPDERAARAVCRGRSWRRGVVPAPRRGGSGAGGGDRRRHRRPRAAAPHRAGAAHAPPASRRRSRRKSEWRQAAQKHRRCRTCPSRALCPNPTAACASRLRWSPAKVRICVRGAGLNMRMRRNSGEPPRILVTSRQGTHITEPHETRWRSPTPVQIAIVPPARLCDHPGCESGGEFPARRARASISTSLFLVSASISCARLQRGVCGITTPGYERARDRGGDSRRDIGLEQRPSWKLGQLATGPAYEDADAATRSIFIPARIRKPGNVGSAIRRAAMPRRASPRPSEQALAVLDIDPPFTQTNLKARYKVLVKMHHPDAHGGDKEAEEKLKIINQAYATTLKSQLLRGLNLPHGIPAQPIHVATLESPTRMPTVEQAELPVTPTGMPDIKVSVRQTFGIDSKISKCRRSARPSEHACPDHGTRPIASDFHDTTLAILAGFAFNRRVMICGRLSRHRQIRPMSSRSPRGSTGRASASTSTAISAASTRSARTRSSCATTSRSPNSAKASLPWALQHPVALCFDEYDAGRPRRDVRDPARGASRSRASSTLLDQNRVIRGPHKAFRPVRHRPTTRSASATRRASITARSRSTRVRWTAGTSSRP